jgi:hypothetical protein
MSDLDIGYETVDQGPTSHGRAIAVRDAPRPLSRIPSAIRRCRVEWLVGENNQRPSQKPRIVSTLVN